MLLGPKFGCLGSLIGKYPWISVGFSTVIAILSLIVIFINPPHFELSFDTGYTTKDAKSIAEMQAQVEFFGNNGRPWYMALFAAPTKPNGSVHNDQEFYEIKSFYKNIKTMPLRYDEERKKNITYYDLCGSTCDLNELLFTTYMLSFFGIEYPVANILNYKSNIGKHFYDVDLNNGYIEQAKLTMLVFMVFSDDNQVRKDLSLFESKVLESAEEYNTTPNRTVSFTVHGETGMEKAVADGIITSSFYFLIGLILTIVLLFCSFMCSSHMFERLKCSRFQLLWFAGLLTTLFSLCTSFAIYFLLNYSVTVLTAFTPFLCLIFSFDTILILSHTWLSDSYLRRDSPADHLREVFATCMPSVVVTATPALGFLIGAAVPIPHYSAVSVLIGFILISTVLYTIFFFAPMLMILAPAARSTTTHQSEVCSECSLLDKIVKSKYLKIILILLLISSLSIIVYIGYRNVEGNLDYRQLLTPQSPRNLGVHYMSDIAWPQFFSIMFFVKSPPDFANATSYGEYKAMIAEIEQIENKHSNETDMTWINDFCRHTKTSSQNAALNMSLFRSFIEDPIYKHWKNGVKFTFKESGEPIITSMLHIVAFNGTKTLADKARLFSKCRDIVSKYSQFKTYPFDTEIGFADVILQVTNVIIVIPLLSYATMFILSSLIIGNFSVAFLNLLMSLFIYIICLSIPSFFGVHINPFTATYLLFIAALSPKFTTHFCYFYQQAIRTNSKADKLNRMHEMYRKSLYPFFVSFICSVSLFLPALFCPVEIFKHIAFLNTLMSLSGFILSLIFLQICLNSIPKTLTGTHFLLSPKNEHI